jgi:hypothetical protein
MKMCFARAKTAVAVAAALSVSALTLPVHAVNHSDNGLGEVGLISYYTVRDNYDTNISVVNTSDKYVVAFKIRFREGANSRDARDFNVFLSPNDVWTATVTLERGSTNPTDPKYDELVPYLKTYDMSCTAPWVGAGGFSEEKDASGAIYHKMPFTSADYTGLTGSGKDAGVQTIVRTQEGHIEIIQMGVADPEVSQLAGWAVHGANQNCKAVADVYPTVNKEITNRVRARLRG